MALRYDFDMFSLIPKSLQDKFSDNFTDLGVTEATTERKAMFRDPETVAALHRADKAVRDFFLKSGFELQVYDSGAPPGRFPAKDEDARVIVIEKLTRNLATHNLKNADWGGFEFSKFLETLSTAEPLDEIDLPKSAPQPDVSAQWSAPKAAAPQPVPLQRPSPLPEINAELGAARRAAQKKKGMRMIAFGGLLLGLLLLFYVAAQSLG